MRVPLTISLVSLVLAAALPAAAQQPAQPGPPTMPSPKVEPTKPALQPRRTARLASPRRRHIGYAVRHRHESLCSVINGWRAFNNPYDPKGYFYTGRVCCCGPCSSLRRR
jgi:hypothetical protein